MDSRRDWRQVNLGELHDDQMTQRCLQISKLLRLGEVMVVPGP